jgi:hypothetical protein
MAVEITLSLPEDLIEQARRIAGATDSNTETVLTDVLDMIWPTLDTFSVSNEPPVSSLPDEEVLELADMKMDRAENKRLRALQTKGKTTGLTAGESNELLLLFKKYQLGQLRKSEALAEAVQRGLRKPLSP